MSSGYAQGRDYHSALGAFRALLVLAFAAAVFAQDPFEIQVYEYKTVSKGMWNLETHLNYTEIGRAHV